MEENEALLEEDDKLRLKNTLKAYSYKKNNFCDSPDSSADESVGWWAEESHSSCNTSCSGPDSVFSADWKSEIDANGELFYIESEPFEQTVDDRSKHENHEVREKEQALEKSTDSRKGKFKNWIKRNRVKRRISKFPCESERLSLNSAQENAGSESVQANVSETCQKLKEILLRLDGLGKGSDVIEKVLGLKTFFSSELQKFFITGFTNDTPLNGLKDVNIGDVLLGINNERLSSENVDRLFESLKFPVELTVTIEKNVKKKSRSALVQSLTNNCEELENVLRNEAVGAIFVHLKSQYSSQKELVYSFPTESILTAGLGSFVTLHHLSPDIALKNKCYSSSAYYKNQLTHVYYVPEDEYLLLIAIPASRCSYLEASYIIADLTRCLLFSHQTLYRCFKCSSTSNLNHFFSVFFSRLLYCGFAANAPRDITLGKVDFSVESVPFQFEHLLQYVECLTLPKEMQIQLDDLLSEVEANYDSEEADEDENLAELSDDDDGVVSDENDADAGYKDDEERKKIKFGKGSYVIGSCVYHKGYLLGSHFSKEDLLNVHSFFRQNGLIQLFRREPVKSLVIWREVYPYSVDFNEPCSVPNYFRRWFLIIIGQEHDAIVFILELHGFWGKLVKHLHSMISFIEYGEERLRHLKKMGISKLASLLLSDTSHSKTVTAEEYFPFKKNKKTDTILDVIKSADEAQKYLESPLLMEIKQSSENILKSSKISYAETSEDSTSQAPSNQSEISDENAPILGRRAERSCVLPEMISDESENSDSDWESFQDLAHQQEFASGILFESKVFKDRFSSRSRLTTGVENSLFHFLHLNESEGILIAPASVSEESSIKLKEIIENFRRAAQLIHSLLDNNVRFKKNNEDGSKSFINKSLVAVKEHGLLLAAGTSLENENTTKKNGSLLYWVIGRLFFTPHRREVYVCHCDDAPQNLVEIGFRLGLCIAE